MKKFIAIACVIASVAFTGCTRISTGEVGVRVDASKQIQGAELMPGSWNQTIVGDVLTFPVKDIAVNLENKSPMTADNSALDDFDVTVVYNVNPSSVSELYTKKSRSFHVYENGDIYLMHSYVSTLVNNAVNKSVREYNALEVADKRVEIEGKIKETVTSQLKAEGLENSINLSVVQVKNILPNKEILKAATDYVRAQSTLRVKATEVEIAKKESERMAALANNSQQSIAYMQAQAALNISEGIKNGKVNTIVVPANFNALMMK